MYLLVCFYVTLLYSLCVSYGIYMYTYINCYFTNTFNKIIYFFAIRSCNEADVSHSYILNDVGSLFNGLISP